MSKIAREMNNADEIACLSKCLKTKIGNKQYIFPGI